MVLNQLHLQVSWMHPEIHSETRWLTQDSERTRDPKTFHRGLTLFSGLLPALKVRPQRTRHSGLWPQCCLTGRKPQIQTSGGSHTSCKFSCETLPFFGHSHQRKDCIKGVICATYPIKGSKVAKCPFPNMTLTTQVFAILTSQNLWFNGHQKTIPWSFRTSISLCREFIWSQKIICFTWGPPSGL